MNDNLGGVLTLIESELREPAEATAIKGYIRDFLWDVKHQRFLFSEKSAEFNTVPGQNEYELGSVNGPPGNIQKIVRMRTLTGSTWNDINQKTLNEIRDRQFSNTAESQYPSEFAWFGRKLHFWATPSAITPVHIDYQIDSTYDQVSGAPFTEESNENFTNEFFREGRALLVSFCLMRWGLGRGRDEALSNAQGAVFSKTMSRLLQQFGKAKWGDGQAGMNL